MVEPGSTPLTETPEEPSGDPAGSRRPTIEERAARRASIEQRGQDRYDSLLRHLRAGREVAIEPGRRDRLDWHPIAGRMLLAVGIGVIVYLVLVNVLGWVRENRVETWSGPVAAESGQRLVSCPRLVRRDDPTFPNWVRFDGRVFERAVVGLPMGDSNIGTYYLDTGVTLGDMRIYDVTVEGIGPLGSRIILRNGTAPAGEVYRLVEGCT